MSAMTDARADALARFYDLDLVDDPGDLDLYLALAERAGGRILEIGVGTGRLAVPLATAGWSVVGVDRDPAMLARARVRATAAGARGGRPAGARRDRRARPPASGRGRGTADVRACVHRPQHPDAARGSSEPGGRGPLPRRAPGTGRHRGGRSVAARRRGPRPLRRAAHPRVRPRGSRDRPDGGQDRGRPARCRDPDGDPDDDLRRRRSGRGADPLGPSRSAPPRRRRGANAASPRAPGWSSRRWPVATTWSRWDRAPIEPCSSRCTRDRGVVGVRRAGRARSRSTCALSRVRPWSS